MNVENELKLQMYRTMLRIRKFEEKLIELKAGGSIPGVLHLYIGEEATATGVCAAIRPDDYITSTHRGHGHCIAKGGDISSVPGLYLPGKGLQGKIDARFDLDDFPLPLPGAHLSVPAKLQGQQVWLPFQSRRGCPMKCSYCSTPMIEGSVLRKRNLEGVVDSLSKYVEAGIDRFFFVDNVFNFPLSYAKELCERLIAKKIKIKWRCILYPWKVDEDLIKKMALAGCQEISLGFESGSPRMIKNMNKRYSPDEVRYICNLLKKYHIQTMGFLNLELFVIAIT